MVYSVQDQYGSLDGTVEEATYEDGFLQASRMLMNELKMGNKEWPKAARLVNTFQTVMQRHITFEEFAELRENLPKEWKPIGAREWYELSYQERVKTTYPLLKELIQQDQMERNFDILYTEEALEVLQGCFTLLRKY